MVRPCRSIQRPLKCWARLSRVPRRTFAAAPASFVLDHEPQIVADPLRSLKGRLMAEETTVPAAASATGEKSPPPKESKGREKPAKTKSAAPVEQGPKKRGRSMRGFSKRH